MLYHRHPYGQIDVSIDTQLHQIKNALEEKMMRGKAEWI